MRAILVTILILVPASALAVGADTDPAVHRHDHFIPIGDATLHVIEKWTDAVGTDTIFFIPATLVPSTQWDSDVPDPLDPADEYNGLVLAAKRGYRVFTVDHEGYGLSSHPEDGYSVTAERMLQQYAILVAWIAGHTGDEQVDLVGASIGSSLAFALSADSTPYSAWVGRIVLTAHVYKEPSLFAQNVFLGPGPCENFESQPNGYMDTLFPMLAPIVINSEPEALLWMADAFPGNFAMGPTVEGCHLPVFEAAIGQAPALVFIGDRDLMSAQADIDLFCAEYGGECAVSFVPGMGHAVNFEATRHEFWAQTFAFFEN